MGATHTLFSSKFPASHVLNCCPSASPSATLASYRINPAVCYSLLFSLLLFHSLLVWILLVLTRKPGGIARYIWGDFFFLQGWANFLCRMRITPPLAKDHPCAYKTRTRPCSATTFSEVFLDRLPPKRTAKNRGLLIRPYIPLMFQQFLAIPSIGARADQLKHSAARANAVAI